MKLLPAFTLVISFLTSSALSMEKSKESSTAADRMKALRLRILSSSPKELGLKLENEKSKVWGVVLDWPIDEDTLSVVSLTGGTASIYTTFGFGVIGGEFHDDVRTAARNLLEEGERLYESGIPTDDLNLAAREKIRVFLIGEDDVRSIEFDREETEGDRGAGTEIFGLAQIVISKLREQSDAKADSVRSGD